MDPEAPLTYRSPSQEARDHVEAHQEPLLEAEAPDVLEHLPAQFTRLHHVPSTILTSSPASRGLLEVVIT